MSILQDDIRLGRGVTWDAETAEFAEEIAGIITQINEMSMDVLWDDGVTVKYFYKVHLKYLEWEPECEIPL